MLIDPSVKQSGSERAKAQGTNAVQEPHAMRNNCHIDGSKCGAAGWWCVQEESGGRGCPAMRSRGLCVRSCDNDETCESPIHDGRACARIKSQAIYESATRQPRRQDQQCLAARTAVCDGGGCCAGEFGKDRARGVARAEFTRESSPARHLTSRDKYTYATGP